MKIQVHFDDNEYVTPIGFAAALIRYLAESPFNNEDISEILAYLSVYADHHDM